MATKQKPATPKVPAPKSVPNKNRLIEITPYQLEKIRIVPFQTKTIIHVVWIVAAAVLLSFIIICLIKFFV